MDDPRVTGVVLAAGPGRRFGPPPKLLVPLGGKPVLAWVLELVERLPLAARVLVLGAHAQEILAAFFPGSPGEEAQTEEGSEPRARSRLGGTPPAWGAGAAPFSPLGGDVGRGPSGHGGDRPSRRPRRGLFSLAPQGGEGGVRGAPPWRILQNPDWPEGMGSSLRRAAEEVDTGMLVFLGDMPWVPEEAAWAVLSRVGERPVAPSFGGQRGFPVYLPVSLRPQLLALRGDVGARDLLSDCELIPWDDPGVIRDVDRWEDLRGGEPRCGCARYRR